MVAPVTDLGWVTDLNISTAYRRRRRWRQKPPFNLNLNYNCRSAYRISKTGNWGPTGVGVVGNAATYWDFQNGTVHSRNMSYEVLRGRMMDRASLGVMLGEFAESARMVANRAVQIARFARAVRKLDFQLAARTLGLSKPPNIPKQGWRGQAKGWGRGWLEFSFGWSPLVGDISSAMDVLVNREPKFRVYGGGKDVSSTRVHQTWSPGTQYYSWTTETSSFDIYTKQGCRLVVSNPNLALANQLGLVNPAVVVWELIPFSFLIDWFANVESVLSQGTDFLGLAVSDQYQRHFATGIATRDSGDVYNGRYETTRNRVIHAGRGTSLTGVTLSVRPWKNPHWRRGLNAISLLVQGLGK